MPSCAVEWYLSFNDFLHCLKVWDQFLAALGSWLTLILVLIYLRQNSVLREQTKVLQAAYSPALQVNSLEPSNHDCSDESDSIDLTITNIGNEVAKNIQIKYLIQSSNHSTLSRFPFFGHKLSLSSASVPVIRQDRVSYYQDENGAAISKGEKQVECTTDVCLTVEDSPPENNPYPFRNAIASISDETGERLQLGMMLKYENSAGIEQEFPLPPGFEFDVIQEPITFKNIFENVFDGGQGPTNAQICDVQRIYRRR